LFDFFFDGHCPIHDPHPVEHENTGTYERFLVKGVGSFFQGGGGSNWALISLPERVFLKQNSSASTSKRRDGVARLALGTLSDNCDSVRIGSSGLRIECPIAPGTQ